VNENDALVLVVEAGGVDVSVVSGGVVVMSHVKDAGVGSVPLVLWVARTWKVWLPAARPVYDRGDVQVANAAPSSEHWNVAPVAGVAVNENEALVLLVLAAGDAVMVVSGGD
jgi:hypothetical protein